MKTWILAALTLVLPSFAQAVDTFELWKATISLPVQFAGTTASGKPVILTKTLKNNDIINLVMGRPLTTKIDAKLEAIALAGDATTPGVGSEIIIVNPQTRAKLATVWTLPTFDVVFANPPDDTVAVVYAIGSVQATVAGTPAQNGFDATSISLAGSGKLASSGALSVTSTALCGPFKFRIAGAMFDGLVTKGSLKVSGASLGVLP